MSISELDIKKVWMRQRVPSTELDQELLVLTKYRSQSIVDKLKILTRIEHFVNVMVSIFLVGFLIAMGEFVASMILLVILIAALYYYKKLLNTIQSMKPSSDVHIYLKLIHSTLKEFIRRYRISVFYLLTASVGIGLYVGVKNKLNVEGDITDPSFYIKIALVYILVIVLSFWLIHLLYGRKANRIREMIRQLEN